MDTRANPHPISEQVHAVLEHLDTPLLAENSSGFIHMANVQARSLLGYRETELVGRHIQDVLANDETTTRTDADETSRAGLVRHKNGRVIPTDLHSIYVPELELTLYEFRTSTKDANTSNTAHKQRSRLAQISRLATMGQLSTSIAHEINQPMGAITLYAQTAQRLLANEELDREKLSTVLAKIADQSLRAGSIIERIQTFSNTSNTNEVVNLNETLAEMQHLVSSDALAHGIELVFDLTPVQVWVTCNINEIQQVLVNLCHNAIEAMDDIGCENGTTITVSTRRSDQFAFVAVDDLGGGIPENTARSLFEPFQTTKPLGTGLGLSMCKSIVEELGGSIEFENKPNGKGSIFKFSLPIQSN